MWPILLTRVATTAAVSLVVKILSDD
jgi:hypothetical protein